LQGYLDHPARLNDDEVRSAAMAAVRHVQEVGSRGRHLQGQLDRLTALLAQSDGPIDIDIESDALTQVSIDGVTDLGRFSTKRVALKPGIYTLVGSRAGYRTVRVDVEVTVGQQQLMTEVRCIDRI
jgi:hypothetical protein